MHIPLLLTEERILSNHTGAYSEMKKRTTKLSTLSSYNNTFAVYEDGKVKITEFLSNKRSSVFELEMNEEVKFLEFDISGCMTTGLSESIDCRTRELDLSYEGVYPLEKKQAEIKHPIHMLLVITHENNYVYDFKDNCIYRFPQNINASVYHGVYACIESDKVVMIDLENGKVFSVNIPDYADKTIINGTVIASNYDTNYLLFNISNPVALLISGYGLRIFPESNCVFISSVDKTYYYRFDKEKMHVLNFLIDGANNTGRYVLSENRVVDIETNNSYSYPKNTSPVFL